MASTISSYRISLARFENRAAAFRMLLASASFVSLLTKAGFRPDQPRVPRGDPDGGKWTDAGGGSRHQRTEGAPKVIRVAGPGALDDEDGDDDNTDYEPIRLFEPSIPIEPPKRESERLIYIRSLLLIPIRKLPAGSTFSERLDAARVPNWVRNYYPHIDAYHATPRTLEQLQSDALTRRPGYDVHHLVERASARNDGHTRLRIEAAENRVGIPTFKHWELNSWYARKNLHHNGLSPRESLRGRDWEEKRNVGLQGLREIGVLKP